MCLYSSLLGLACTYKVNLCFSAAQVPDLCPSCVRVLEEADYAALSACIQKDLDDGMICLKGGAVCIKVDDAVRELLTNFKRDLDQNMEPLETRTIAGICP